MELAIEDWNGVFTVIGSVAGGIYAFLKAIEYKTKSTKIIAVGESFNKIVNKLSSKDSTEQISAAILLRRFFDPKTEMGIGSTPYAKEAINVIAASLRTLPVNNFQKILADSLAYAPSNILKGADLQKTNLQNAYLGVKDSENIKINLAKADFYRADLSKASFKGAILNGAQFYQARLMGTVFKDADLQNSNFYEADILDANFSGAKLLGANFMNARNIPNEILIHLDSNGIYHLEELNEYKEKAKIKVFISKPNSLNLEQQIRYNNLLQIIKERVDIETFERDEYQPFGVLSNIRNRIKGCSGLIIIGFEQLKVEEGDFRFSTNEYKKIHNISLATPWNHIEAGMAAMIGLPILVLADEGVNDGIFENKLDDAILFYSSFSKKLDHKKLREDINKWYNAIQK